MIIINKRRIKKRDKDEKKSHNPSQPKNNKRK